MREIYEQFIAYGRAYASSLSSYTADDDPLARANVGASTAISAICDAITYGSVITKTSTVQAAEPPSNASSPGDPSNPVRFISTPIQSCVTWVTNSTQFEADLAEWTKLDPNVPASQWSPDERAVQEGAAKVFKSLATEMVSAGRSSGNQVFEDIAQLAALYLQAYAGATDNYTNADNYISLPGLRLNNMVTAACQAVGR